VEFLLEKGAAPDPVTLEGDTPLHKAVVGNHTRVIELLAAAGADVNAQVRLLGRAKLGYNG
jgi:ankyrin repeat protein